MQLHESRHFQLNLGQPLQYLQGYISLNSGASVGLGVSDALTRVIPGNHDHWPGRTATFPLDLVMLGNNPAQTLYLTFPSLPVPVQRVSGFVNLVWPLLII